MSDSLAAVIPDINAPVLLHIRLHEQWTPELKRQWLRALSDSRPADLFQHPAWQATFFEAQSNIEGISDPILVAVVSGESGPLGILPFSRGVHTTLGIRLNTLELMRPCDMGVRNLILNSQLDPARIWRELRTALTQAGIRWDQCDLSDILLGSDAMRFMQASGLPSIHFHHHDSNRLAVSGRDLEERRGRTKSHLKKVRRKANALERLGALEYRLLTTSEELSAALNHYVDIEDSGWKGSQGEQTSMRHDHLQRSFYQKLLAENDQYFKPVAAELLLNGEPIAVKLCAEVGNTLYMLKIAYADAYRDHSPGNILLLWLLEQYEARDGIDYISFVTGGEWTQRWSPEKQQAHTATVYNKTLIGLLAALSGSIKNQLRQIKRKTPGKISSAGEEQ